MTYNATHLSVAPARESMDQFKGPVLLEFGTPWCGHCARAQPLIETALAGHADVVHLKVQDGPGQRLGRSFGVKLWPTLIFLKDGTELVRLVRPRDGTSIAEALTQIDDQSSSSTTPGNNTST